MKVLPMVLGFLVAFGAARICGAEPGDQVVIVYNTRMRDSKSVADYYAQKRHVPTNQIFGFDLPEGEDVSRAQFRDNFQQPLAQALETNELWHIASRLVPATTNQPGRMEWRV